MSAETSGDVSHIQDEDVLRKMWQETEDFGKKKDIRSHMYKLREERLRNFYSSNESSTEIQRTQSTPGLHDKTTKEGNGPTHADSLADHSFLSLKSKEIRDSESPTREMHYRVDKNRGGDQGWNVVTKNETSNDGKTHTTTRVASTSGTDKIDGGVANYAAKCEQQASVFNDGDANNFTKSVSASSKNVIQQEAKGGDDHSNFQSFSTNASSSSKTVSHHHSSSGDTTNLKTLPSNVGDSSSTTVIRKTYTTEVPEELKRSPNYIDGNTKVFTETRTLPDGTKVTTTRYETRGGKTVTSSSTDNYSTSNKQVVSEQKSSTTKSSSSKTESHSSNKMIQDNRNTYDDVDRTRITNQANNIKIIRHVPDNFDNTERTVSVQVIKSSNDDVNKNVSQNISKTSSTTVQKGQQIIDSRNIDINVEGHRVIQTKDIHDNRRDTVKQIGDVERNIDVRQESVSTKGVRTHTSQDIQGTNQDDVRITRLIKEKEYLPRDKQPDFERIPDGQQATSTTSTTTRREVLTTKGDTVKTKTTKDVHGQTQDDVRIIKIIQDNEYSPRDRQPVAPHPAIEQHPDSSRQEIVTTTKETVTTKTSENIPTTVQDDVHTIKVIREKEYLPRDRTPASTPGDRTPAGRTPGERTPAPSTPGDRTPAISTPGDRTPALTTPGDRTPAVQEIVCRLIPQQERPETPRDQQQSYTTKTTTTITTHVDKTGDKKVVTDDFINKERTHVKDTRPQQKEPTPRDETPQRLEPTKPQQREPSPAPQYEAPERRQPIKPGKSELDGKPTPTDGQYQTTYGTDYVNRRISVEVSPTHDAFARSLRAISPDRDKKRGSTRSLKSSTSSLRSSTSPEKYPIDRRQPGRLSPHRKPDSRGSSPTKRRSPDKYTSTETVTKVSSTVCSPRRSPTKQTHNETINTDTITRRHKTDARTNIATVTRTSPDRKPIRPSTNEYGSITRTSRVSTDDVRRTTDTNEIDSSTLTRRPKVRPRSRSQSPTSVASDIEFVKSSELVTDLDAEDTVTTSTHRTDTSKLDIRSNVEQIRRTVVQEDTTDKRPTSLDVTPKKPRKITDRSSTSPLSSPTKKSPTKVKPQEKPFKRRDTYEERCRQILGIADKTTVDKTTTETKRTTKTRVDETARTPRKPIGGTPRSPSKSPTKEIQEFPSHIRRSPEKQPLEKIPGKTRPTKEAPKIQEFPSQIRRSPEKEPLQKPPEKRRPSKEKPKVQEFPSQIRRSPEKQPFEKPSERPRVPSYQSKIQEFPSQIRRSPEKQPLEKPPEKTRPSRDRPTVREYPSQVKKVPELGKAPGAADEPLFTKKFISTLCREEELERTDVRKSPERRLPQTCLPVDSDSDEPHRTVKKDSPERIRTSPERKQPVTKKFIDTERTDTDITITRYGEEPKRQSPDRRSPERKTTRERYDTDENIQTRDVTEYTDEYITPDRDGRRPSDRGSPVRSTLDTETCRVATTGVTEYTDEYQTPDGDLRRPSKPGRESPDRSTYGTTRTKISDVTEYTDEYHGKTAPGDGRPKPKDRKPERESPERFRGVTEYTDTYNVDKRERTSTDRVTKSTTKTTPKGSKPSKPRDDDEETTDSESETTARVVKETTTTIINGDVSRRSPSKPSRVEAKPKPGGITEYPSQKPKPGKSTTKTTKTTTTTRKDKKDEKVTLYNIENLRNTEVDDKVHTRTHRIDDYYVTKTTKPLTNGDVPKGKFNPKRFEPKLGKPSITEFPSQRIPERKKTINDKPQRKPVDQTPERKTPKKPETRVVSSPRDKTRSPDRYSPSRPTTDSHKVSAVMVTRKTVTKSIRDTKTPTKTVQRQPETQPSPKRHVVTTTIQVVPRTKPEGPRRSVGKTTVAHTTTTVKTTKLTEPKSKTKPRKPVQNGRLTTEDSETEEEIVDDLIDTKRVTEDTCRVTRRTDAKITRTNSDQVIKTPYRTPVRGLSKPEILPSKITRTTDTDKTTKKTDKKVITTKSIIINNDYDTEREVIVNLQRSKSSREPTPEGVCPRPASEDEDTGIPRYPDQISEPDEPSTRRKPTRLSDIPIIESEGTDKFTRVTEYEDGKKTTVTRRVDKVDEKDECLLSVNQKVSKFVDQADKLTKIPKSTSPTRKPIISVDETRETSEKYGDKFTKFVSTTEQLTTERKIPERPKSPRCKNYPDADVDDEPFTSVSEKVSHFIETAQKIKHPQKPSLKDGPAPKVKRPAFTEVDETIRTDDCLLSVSDKVSKFSTVTKLQSPDYKKPVSLAKMDITPKRESPTRESPRRESPRRESPLRESPRRESPKREFARFDSPKRESPSRMTTECVQIDSEEQMYTRRVSPDRYSPTRREGSPRLRDDKTPTRTTDRPSTLTKTESRYHRKDIKEIDTTPKSSRRDDEPKSVLSPTGRLRSTESIRKAKELFENIAKDQKTTTTTKQRDILSRPSVFEGRKSKHPEEDVKLTDIGVYKLRTDTETTDTTRKLISSTCIKDDSLKSTYLIMDKLNRSHSPEGDSDVPSYMKPLDRSQRPVSPYYGRSRSPKLYSKSPSRERSPRPHDQSLDEIPHYMWPLDRSLHDHPDRERSYSPRSREPTPDLHGKIRSRASTPDNNVPGYMKPIERNIRPKSPHRKHEPEKGVTRRPTDDTERTTTKFGVTLKRTDSGRAATTTTTTTTTSQQRKLSTVEVERILKTQEIEEIYNLEILEVLLERVTSYEQRRRIRAQIRIVKQLISENKLSTVIKKTTKTVSPTRDSPKTRGTSPDKPARTDRKSVDKSRTEYQTEYIRKVSPTRKPVENKLYQHTDIVSKRSGVDRKTEYQSSYAYSERRTSSEVNTHVRETSPEMKIIRASPEKAPRKSITTVEKIGRRSPERKTERTETRSVFKTELKRTAPLTKTVVEEKPSWVTQRPLKKTTARKTSSTSTTASSTIVKKQTTSRTSPSKDRRPIDEITSSYGVGPTDENGSPLFGLKALRTQNRADTTTKVKGTVMKSHYYSENGQEPTGEISVTKYSTDPRDLDGNVSERNGLVSVTTTQKFGAKGTPSYKSVIDRKKITDLDDEQNECLTKKTTTTTKVSRRGSVKEMSKKFIDNAVETSKNERQSSYPKAGLILRTSSFKDTAKGGTSSSRESSPEKQTTVTTTTVRKTTSSSSSGGRTDTFLNNKTRVRGVQDVITRMKNADDDVQAGESPEDTEARNLLNKFIGSQVILSGMETRSSTSSSPSASHAVRRTTTTTTTTSKGGGKPTVVTRTFTHPITDEELNTVWDEQTLKLLLERSTDYEERRIVRARLRDVMAEQEVCADVVAKTKEESNGRIEEKVETSKKTFTEGPVTTQVSTRVTSQQVTKKPISPFAKFRQLDKQNSLNTPPGTPRTPTGSRPLFKFTDPEVGHRVSTVKDRLLQWCQMKTKEYENVQLDNFSGSWADGLAFCALIHHFLPDAFDYHALTPKNRQYNFELAFRVADEKADILPLLDVEDMVATRKPDWKCVFTYVQTIYAHFKNED